MSSCSVFQRCLNILKKQIIVFKPVIKSILGSGRRKQADNRALGTAQIRTRHWQALSQANRLGRGRTVVERGLRRVGQGFRWGQCKLVQGTMAVRRMLHVSSRARGHALVFELIARLRSFWAVKNRIAWIKCQECVSAHKQHLSGGLCWGEEQ